MKPRCALAWILAAVGLLPACAAGDKTTSAPSGETRLADQRREMVRHQIEARGIKDPAVLAAMRKVPRDRFVPEAYRSRAYEDSPLPIGYGQTISQPYIVGVMTELLRLRGTDKVLEIGTGSGYQAAVLAEIARDVYSIEIVPELYRRASEVLVELGYKNIHLKAGDGYKGWPEHAPFDAIIVTAAPGHIPRPLKQQLRVGGRLVIPVGSYLQTLVVVTRAPDGYREERVFPVRFVPMTGLAQETDETTD